MQYAKRSSPPTSDSGHATKPDHPTRKGVDHKSLKGADFAAGEAARKPPDEKTKGAKKDKPRPPDYEGQLARFEKLVTSTDHKYQRPDFETKPMKPPTGVDMSPEEWGSLHGYLLAAAKLDPLWAMFEKMGADPEVMLQAIRNLREQDDQTAMQTVPSSSKIEGVANESLDKVARDPKEYNNLFKRGLSVLHFGAAVQLAHTSTDAGLGWSDLQAAAVALVEGFIAYFGQLASATGHEHFDAVRLTWEGAPPTEVLQALREIEIRDPALATALGTRLFAAFAKLPTE